MNSGKALVQVVIALIGIKCVVPILLKVYKDFFKVYITNFEY